MASILLSEPSVVEYSLNMPSSGALLAYRKSEVYVVLVDDDIAEELRGVRLCVNRKGYVVLSKKWRGHFMLHTSIIGAMDGLVIDHVNGDKMDNRRANLQYATNAENCRKRPRHLPNRTGFRGVAELKSGRYSASIMVNYKRKHLGVFDTAEDAARAYDKAARETHGSFGCLNFPVVHEIKAVARW